MVALLLDAAKLSTEYPPRVRFPPAEQDEDQACQKAATVEK
jgi:hypothetical protein